MLKKKWIESVSLGRFILPVALGLAALGILVTESTYQNARSTLSGGIALTDARLRSADLLQALSEHEIATRQFVFNGDAAAAQHQRLSTEAVRRAHQHTFELVRKLNVGNNLDLAPLNKRVEAQLARVEAWCQQVKDGRSDLALSAINSDASRRARAHLRTDFDDLLRRATELQHTARTSLYDALMLNRLAVHLLIGLTVLALVLFVRSLRQVVQDKEREQSRLAGLVEDRTATLRELAEHLVTAREDERARLARELHDDLGGLLTAIKLDFMRLRRSADMPAAAKERLAAIDARLNEGIALKRSIIENLRPSALDLLGLGESLQIMCRDVAANLGVPVRIELAPVRVAKDAELTIYRLVQESLTNISKYAECKEVRVTLRPLSDARVEVLVADDGRGFDAAAVSIGRHGLLGMRFRVEAHGGKLTVSSTPGAGTVVRADLPALLPAANGQPDTAA